MIKKLLLLAALFPAACALYAQEAEPRAALAGGSAEVRDRLETSLFFRGELADLMLDAGVAGRYADLSRVETHSDARSLLLEWIRRNPQAAASVYLELKGGGGVYGSLESRQITWKFNPSFIEAIKALNAAAGSSSVSREAMELAARRLYAESGPESEAPAVEAGGAAGKGTGFFSINYADHRLNRAGLAREVAQAGAWLEAARPAAAAEGGAYSAAFGVYREFLLASSSLKGREAVTARESALLEALRLRLRSSLAVLSLRARVSAVAEMEAALSGVSGEPGARDLLAALAALKARLEERAGLAASGKTPLSGLGKLVNSGENEFSSLYLRYTAYDGLLNLRRRAASYSSAFSCLYDYAFFRYLAAFYPASPYPAARAKLAAAQARLGSALAKTGAGDFEGALSGLDAGGLEAAAETARAASRLNRAAQFFGWELLLRPVEYRVSAPGGRVRFRPAVTFFEVAVKNNKK